MLIKTYVLLPSQATSNSSCVASCVELLLVAVWCMWQAFSSQSLLSTHDFTTMMCRMKFEKCLFLCQSDSMELTTPGCVYTLPIQKLSKCYWQLPFSLAFHGRLIDCKSKVGDLYRGSLRSRSLQSRSTILPLFIGPYACCHITAH